MIITKEILDSLARQAAESPRLRANLDLRTSAADGSQRMLNALHPGTVVPIHRHPASSETVIILQGSLEEIFYDDEGRETARHLLTPGGETPMLNIPAGQWHTVNVLAPATIIFEAKDGAYAPASPNDIR